jgi:hypothetical protein
MVNITINSPLNKRKVKGAFTLRLGYSGDVSDKQVAIYANGTLHDVYTAANAIPLNELKTRDDGKVELTAALINEDGDILDKKSINLLYSAATDDKAKRDAKRKAAIPEKTPLVIEVQDEDDDEPTPVYPMPIMKSSQNEETNDEDDDNFVCKRVKNESDRKRSKSDCEASKSDRVAQEYSDVEQRSGWSTEVPKSCEIKLADCGCGRRPNKLADCGCGRRPEKLADCGCGRRPEKLGEKLEEQQGEKQGEMCATACHVLVVSGSTRIPEGVTHVIVSDDAKSSYLTLTLPDFTNDGVSGRCVLQVLNYSCHSVKLKSNVSILSLDGACARSAKLDAASTVQLIYVGSKWYLAPL